MAWLGLAMMEIHQEIIPNIGNVIDKFSIGNTRLKLNISACKKTTLAASPPITITSLLYTRLT
jgi:hypothetical protein